MIALIIIIVIIIILLIVSFTIYNRVQGARVQVQNAKANIDNQYKRRSDLIPNLVETVKGYAKHEKTTFENITKFRGMINDSSASMNKRANADNALTRTLNHLFAVAENYPELKANQNFLNLQENLTNTENMVAFARQNYNNYVKVYNTYLVTIPYMWFKNVGHFQKDEFIQINEKERKTPKVKF